jgi:hypothetical protein
MAEPAKPANPQHCSQGWEVTKSPKAHHTALCQIQQSSLYSNSSLVLFAIWILSCRRFVRPAIQARGSGMRPPTHGCSIRPAFIHLSTAHSLAILPLNHHLSTIRHTRGILSVVYHQLCFSLQQYFELPAQSVIVSSCCPNPS